MIIHSTILRQFKSLEELNEYTAGKYQMNASEFNEYDVEQYSDNVRIFSISASQFMPITLPDTDKRYWVSMPDFPVDIEDNHVLIILGALNINKSDMSGFSIFNNKEKILIISTKYFKTIELAFLVIDKKAIPGWMNIVYEVTK